MTTVKPGVRQVGDAAKVLRERYARVAGKYVAVGVFQGSHKRPDGAADGLSLAELAAIHEFGAPSRNIPERSFIRSGVERKMPELKALVRKLTPLVGARKVPEDRALGLIGTMAVGAVQARFGADDLAPLQPATIARKGSSRPLIDTGQLRASITWQIVNPGGGK